MGITTYWFIISPKLIHQNCELQLRQVLSPRFVFLMFPIFWWSYPVKVVVSGRVFVGPPRQKKTENAPWSWKKRIEYPKHETTAKRT